MDSFEEKFPWNFMSYHQGYPMPGAMMPVESPMAPWMGMAGGYPVYPANMYPQAYLDEMQNERDMKKMKELYPEVAKDVLSVVEDECDQMEYDGSMMFDEYPDKVMFERIKNRIYDKVQEKYPVEEEDDRDQAMVMQQEVGDVIRRVKLAGGHNRGASVSGNVPQEVQTAKLPQEILNSSRTHVEPGILRSVSKKFKLWF